MATLDPDGGPVEVGDIILFTPGIEGEAEVAYPVAGGTRAPEQVSPRMAAALAGAGLIEQVDVELTGGGSPTGRAAVGAGGSEIVARVPGPGPSFGQVVLLIDEDGVLSWHSPEVAEEAGTPVRGGTAANTYRIAVRPVGGEPGRGPLGWLGRKLLKVIAFRLLDDVLGHAGGYLADRWERERSWYGLRTVTADGLDGPAPDWTALTAGPALLFVHGTFSRAASAFSGLPDDVRRDLVAAYAGRVVVLDHPTVSVDPVANAQWFADQFVAGTPDAPDARLVLDVVSHSRGGLVTRALAEQHYGLDLAGRHLEVRTAVLVASPNAGTVLADVGHLGRLLDTYTNLLDLIPDAGALDALQLVIEVVKQVATGLARGLDGLMAMDPAGEYLARLNGPASERAGYAAVAADFEPATGAGARSRALDLIVDGLFAAANDLVVPREGGWSVAGRSLVPPGRRLSIDPGESVSHFDYFPLAEVAQGLRNWLKG